MATICTKTLNMTSNKTITECTTFGDEGNLKEKIKNTRIIRLEFQKMFFIKRAQKLFIRCSDYENELALVFDVKNQLFYFAENLYTNNKPCFYYCQTEFAVDKEDLVYMYRSKYGRYRSYSDKELKIFQYCDDKLVDTGKTEISLDCIKLGVSSFCIV